MKKLSVKTATVLIVAIAGTAMAATTDTAQVTVNATVTGMCKVNSAPTLTLTLDPTTTGSASSSGNISLWCTTGTPYTVSDPGPGSTGTYNADLVGNDAATGNTGQLIPFVLTYNTGGMGAGKSNAINSFVTATVLNGDFVNATTGTYTKSVVMTITP